MSTKPREDKPSLSLWVIDKTDAAKMTPADVARYVGVREDTVRGWESGRGIGKSSRAKLRELFGELPGERPPVNADLGASIAALMGALDRERVERVALLRAIEALNRSLPKPPGDGASPELPAPRTKAG